MRHKINKLLERQADRAPLPSPHAVPALPRLSSQEFQTVLAGSSLGTIEDCKEDEEEDGDEQKGEEDSKLIKELRAAKAKT